MITKSEYDTYAAHGCADFIDVDRASGRAAFERALKTATNTAENRVDCARLAFDTAAHYRRLSRLDGLDEQARSFTLTNIDFYTLRGRLLLTQRTEKQINDACAALLRAVAQ